MCSDSPSSSMLQSYSFQHLIHLGSCSPLSLILSIIIFILIYMDSVYPENPGPQL